MPCYNTKPNKYLPVDEFLDHAPLMFSLLEQGDATLIEGIQVNDMLDEPEIRAFGNIPIEFSTVSEMVSMIFEIGRWAS